MGASVSGYWPGITDEQSESLPGFYNDCKAWGDWMAERYSHPEVLAVLKQLGLTALLSHVTDGMDEDEVDWVTPVELMTAAEQLRELVLARDPRVQCVVDSYALWGGFENPVHEEFAQDLADVRLIARFSKEMGIPEMTLEVNR